VSRATYAALFAAIGTTYGAGDGSTTFSLPDLRGRAPFGKDDNVGRDFSSAASPMLPQLNDRLALLAGLSFIYLI